MKLAKYEGELYEYSGKKNGIEIRTKGKKEGFVQRKWGTDVISYKIVPENEIEERIEVYYFVTWKGEEYTATLKRNNIILIDVSGVESKNKYYFENGFEMRDRGEFCKFVPESECSNFIVKKKYFENNKWVEKERENLTLEEFKKIYFEYKRYFI